MSARRRPVEQWVDEILSGGSGLSPTDRLVAVALSRYMDFTTLGDAYPGAARLSADTGFDVRTVQRWLKRLEEKSWIDQTARGGTTSQGVKYASTYRGVHRSEREDPRHRAVDPSAEDPVTPGTGSEDPR